MQIAKAEKGLNFPVKAMTEEMRNGKVIELGYWLQDILSLDGETSESRLKVLLPMVHEFCWSMTLNEIREAFTKYIKGELPIEPRTNYLDVILFGKVITAYKQQRKPKPQIIDPVDISEEEISENALENILLAYDAWEEFGEVPTDYKVAFDRLYDWKILPDKDSSEAIQKAYHNKMCRAHLDLISPLFDKLEWAKKEDLSDTPKYRQMKERYHELNNYKHPEVQARFKCLVLAGFFKKTDRETLRIQVTKALEEYN